MTLWDDLKAEFPREAISWRAQTVTKNGDKALALAYIDARDVMNRLDSVVGAEHWQNRYEVHGNKTICYLSIEVEKGVWVTKADGAGETDVEAEKGSISDALKRAAVLWGIGRYLYDIPAPWVPCETYEKGGKQYWSKWAEDPWNHVRGKPQQQALSTPKPKAPEPERFSKADSRQTYTDLQKALDSAETLLELKQRWDGLQPVIKTLPADWVKELGQRKNRCKDDLAKKAQGLNQIQAPDFSRLEPNDLDPIDELIGENNG